jgi:hypothetical protein
MDGPGPAEKLILVGKFDVFGSPSGCISFILHQTLHTHFPHFPHTSDHFNSLPRQKACCHHSRLGIKLSHCDQLGSIKLCERVVDIQSDRSVVLTVVAFQMIFLELLVSLTTSGVGCLRSAKTII